MQITWWQILKYPVHYYFNRHFIHIPSFHRKVKLFNWTSSIKIWASKWSNQAHNWSVCPVPGPYWKPYFKQDFIHRLGVKKYFNIKRIICHKNFQEQWKHWLMEGKKYLLNLCTCAFLQTFNVGYFVMWNLCAISCSDSQSTLPNTTPLYK